MNSIFVYSKINQRVIDFLLRQRYLGNHAIKRQHFTKESKSIDDYFLNFFLKKKMNV